MTACIKQGLAIERAAVEHACSKKYDRSDNVNFDHILYRRTGVER